jgi:hypothetical protein
MQGRPRGSPSSRLSSASCASALNNRRRLSGERRGARGGETRENEKYHNSSGPSLRNKGALPTPAMAAGIPKCHWTIRDLLNLADDWEAMQKVERAVGYSDDGRRFP